MDGSACGTMPRLPALSPRRALDNLRERFAALRGTGGAVRLLVDDRPEDDRRHHLEGAIAGQIRGVETENRTLATVATAGWHGSRRLVRAWMIASPATAEAVAAACKAAGAAMHPTLVAAGLVGETLLPASAAWSAALAATSSGGAVRLVAKPHAMGDAEVVLPEAIPATGMVADLAAILERAELTPDRLFVVEDVVEASIVLIDRLIELLAAPDTATPAALPAEPAAVAAKGRRTKGQGKRGRPPKDDPNFPTAREHEAAWWRDQGVRSEIGVDEDCPDDINLRKVFDGLNKSSLEIDLQDLGKAPVPAWWPKAADGKLLNSVKWSSRRKGWKPATFKKYCERVDNSVEGGVRIPRATAVNTEPTELPDAGGKHGKHPRDCILEALDDAVMKIGRLKHNAGTRQADEIVEDIRVALLTVMNNHRNFVRKTFGDLGAAAIVNRSLEGDAEIIANSLVNLRHKIEG
jgi:hypothetical protein